MTLFARGLLAILAMGAFIGAAEAGISFGKATCPVAANVALKVIGAKGEIDGVASEYQWLKANRPGWRSANQSVMHRKGRSYDILTIGKDGKHQTICFDITDFFGKLQGLPQ